MTRFMQHLFHADGALVYHSQSRCPAAAMVASGARDPSTGDLPECPECTRRHGEDAWAARLHHRTFAQAEG